MAVSVIWHGHGTFSVDVDGTRIIIDPFFAPNNPAATVTADEVSADYILITHGHGDHVADAEGIAKRTGAKLIANFEIVNWFGAKGLENVHPQHVGGGFKHGFGHLKLTPAWHGSAMPDGSYGGMPCGLLLTIQGKKLYFAGDTGLFSDMALIGEGGLDVAILPIGDNFTMGPDDSIRAIKFLNPKAVIPCHFNTWPPIAQDVGVWADRVSAETEATPVVLKSEESYIL